jgi:predicted O-linked N-acetylglucosamine transferase (SPINDLY family)
MVQISPVDTPAFDRAVAAYRAGNLVEAEQLCQHVLASRPDFFDAFYLLGEVQAGLGKIDAALANYERALEIWPNAARAHHGRGVLLEKLKRYEEALANYERALSLRPNFSAALFSRGNLLQAQGRLAEALASYNRAIELRPDFVLALYNRGRVLQRLNRPGEALASFERAIALKPDFAMAHYNRGTALNALKRHEEALASYDKAIALKPDFAPAHNARGVTLNELRRFEESVASYEKAVSLKADIQFLSNALTGKMAICDWRDFEDVIAQLAKKVELGESAATPQLLLTVSDSPELQRKAAEIWTLAKHPFNNAIPTITKRPRREKIRLGYFCSDFYDHPTTRLIAELFEKHDRGRFDLVAFSFGPDPNDQMRQRSIAAFNEFVDVRNQPDRDVAMFARRREVDIAIDLNGHQKNSRTGIFACRAAPLQVSYLAYPGTMGASYIDYLIADPTVIAEMNQKHFSEKIAYLPSSYQANDRKRRIADKAFSRSEVGLPDTGFVYCCFNNNFKITPDVFEIWMRVINQVEGSVLWLLQTSASAAANLRKEAAARGVNPERLVFAERMLLPDHLARHRLADLFLDTLPYNAHTTASDALWTGLPVLTRSGETFAARVAAGLLTAIGLPELITSTPRAYEELAIELAINPDKLATLKHKLANNRLATPLFDSELFTKQIEAAYTAMYQRYHAGLPPDHIYVAN